MQVTIETTSNLERRLTVGLPAQQVDGEVDNRLQQAAKNVRLPGFRPGKVPMKVMRQRFGANVRQEVLGEVVSRSFQEAVTQEKLRPAGEPVFEPKNMDEGKDIQYVATFEVFPEVELSDMQGFAIERPVAAVKEDDVDRVIESFRKAQGEWEEVDRAAEQGDKVNIDYVGRRGDEAFEGGSAEAQDLELGSGSMIPGFEEGIIGLRAGVEKTLSLTFPDSYHQEELQGAAVEFAITLNRVTALKLAEVNSELFAKYGVSDGGEEKFRQEIGENMRRELKNAIDGKVKEQVMDAVVNAHESLELPKALVDSEISSMRGQMFQQFGGGASKDLDLDTLLPNEMFAENAERRVRLGLVLAEYVSRNEIKADEDRVREAIEEMASTYETPQEVIDYYYSDSQQLASVESKVLEDLVVEKLLAGAAIIEKECSYQDAVAR
ncbi:MAG: trigger factor [Halioglobus sp.]|nr:trigger factor [Halioglobus sp.]